MQLNEQCSLLGLWKQLKLSAVKAAQERKRSWVRTLRCLSTRLAYFLFKLTFLKALAWVIRDKPEVTQSSHLTTCCLTVSSKTTEKDQRQTWYCCSAFTSISDSLGFLLFLSSRRETNFLPLPFPVILLRTNTVSLQFTTFSKPCMY